MTEGVTGLITLYDVAGNPVTVQLTNGAYRLLVADDGTRKLLEQILEQLEILNAAILAEKALL